MALMPGGVNHRELLAMLERQASRFNALEAGLASLDERMREQPCASLASQHSPGRASPREPKHPQQSGLARTLALPKP